MTALLESRLAELDGVLARLELAAEGSPEATFLEAEERRLLRLLDAQALAPARSSV